ncbi:MAG: outer membrane protein assembly factor BamA [Planctomycetota bacterium]|jgi:outer membrane protein assembly complex protein YaeT
MKKIWKVVFVFFVFWGVGSMFAANENIIKTTPISRIETAGNSVIDESRILARVRSRAGELFDESTASEDSRRIAKLEGVAYSYYNIEVIDKEVVLTFVVVERNLVRKIDFVGNRNYKDVTLRKKVGFKIGDFLDAALASAATEELVKYYRQKGFAFVRAELDAEKLSVGEVIYNIEEGPRVKIAAATFSGNSVLATKSLRKVVKTKKKRFFVFSRYYVEDRVDADVTKLQDAYYKKGFLDIDVKLQKRFSEDKTKIYLTFAINEGPVYTVERINIVGNKHFEAERLREELKLERGQPYSRQRVGFDIERLLKVYREMGFLDVQVEHSRSFTSPDKVDVQFSITEGERFRIGQINITGNQQTQDKVIRHILDEYGFAPGRWFNAEIARGDGNGYLEKLVRSGSMSQTAAITPVGGAEGVRDAQVSITEGQTGMVMLGAGIASDSGVIGQLVFEQKNFDISDRPESLKEFIAGKAFQGAGQHFRIALQPGTEVSEYSVSFTEPYLGGRPISLDVIGSSYERGRESYDEQRTKGYVGFEKRYQSQWRRSAGFRVENVDVGSLDSDAPKEVTDDKGSNLLAGIRIGLGKDNTDDKFDPSRGYSFNAGYEQVGGDHTFGILSGTHRWYKTLHEDIAERKTILATKLYVGTIVGNAPVFEKFYAGGQGSIRGFDYRGISTRGLQQNVTPAERKDPIGSDWLFLANAEVAVPLVDNLAALFFVDSGAIDSGNYRASIGTGIQITAESF